MKLTQKELEQILVSHVEYLKSNGNGQRADLRDADLRDADLRDADLRRALLRGALLQRADLRRADLRRADLRGALLRGALLRGAFLRGALLQDADLQDADLQDADLRDADLRGALLRVAVKVKIAQSFSGLYRYDVLVIVGIDDNIHVKMGCFFRSREEWDRDFWNNPGEFPNNKSVKSILRKMAYEYAIKWAELQLSA